jgi:hypothetical protein
MDLNLKYPDLTPDELKQMGDIATDLQCDLRTAEYVMRLEERLARMDEQLAALWNEHEQR